MLFVFPALVSSNIDGHMGSLALKSIEFYYLNRIVESIMSDYIHFSVVYNGFLDSYSNVMLESVGNDLDGKDYDLNNLSVLKEVSKESLRESEDELQQKYTADVRPGSRDRYTISSLNKFKDYIDLRPVTIILSVPVKVYRQSIPLVPSFSQYDTLSSVRDIPISVKIIPIQLKKDITKEVLKDVTQSIFTNPLSRVVDGIVKRWIKKLKILMTPVINMLKVQSDEDQDGFNLYIDILSNDQIIVNNLSNIRNKKILFSDKYLDFFSGILLFNKVEIEPYKDFVFNPQFTNRMLENGWLSMGIMDELSNMFYFMSKFLSRIPITAKVGLDVLAYSLEVKDIFDDYKKLHSVVKRMIGLPQQQTISSFGASILSHD